MPVQIYPYVGKNLLFVGICDMPEICRFFGIIIRMYVNDHNPPHFHVECSGDEALIRISDLKLLRGELPKTQRALVLGWAFEHRDELVENWALAQAGLPVKKIESPED